MKLETINDTFWGCVEVSHNPSRESVEERERERDREGGRERERKKRERHELDKNDDEIYDRNEEKDG